MNFLKNKDFKISALISWLIGILWITIQLIGLTICAWIRLTVNHFGWDLYSHSIVLLSSFTVICLVVLYLGWIVIIIQLILALLGLESSRRKKAKESFNFIAAELFFYLLYFILALPVLRILLD